MRIIRFCFAALILLQPAMAMASMESHLRRVQANLLVGNSQAAVKEAKEALQLYPHEPKAYVLAIQSLAAIGADSEMMALWHDLHENFKHESMDQDLLEEMCWGILHKGMRAPGVVSQLISLIGAALAQDMKAVPFLLQAMRHSNAHLREIGVELASFYGDYPLREELVRLFKDEIDLNVRLKVILAIGKLEMDSLLPDLMRCVASPKTPPKEKLAAIEAIVGMKDSLGEDEVKALIADTRSGLRQLACEVITTCDLKEYFPLIAPLIKDSNPEVVAAALKTWGVFRKPVNEDIKRLAKEALDPLVGVTAAWVWLIDAPEEGAAAMSCWLENEQASTRALAAAAISAAGPYGIPLAKEKIKEATDPYVRVNLCLALAGQREETPRVQEVLEDLLLHNTERWMQAEKGVFKPIQKSNLTHDPAIPNYPEVVNQTIRLELFNLLAILESPRALETIKSFLKEKKWGVTGLAAETLLGEGDESAIDLVRELLKDPDPDIRIEAALVLASWAKDLSAVPVLLEVYPRAERSLQLKILESLGRIGDKSTLCFLIERLKEPSLMVRMVAASVLIQTLNH